MNKKTQIVLLSLIIAILLVVPESFASPQYLTNLTAVYGGGSCGTCHITNSGGGQRDFNGTVGQHNSSNGTFERRDPNRTARSNGTLRQRSSNRTLPLNPYGMLFENQPDHAADPRAALIAIGAPPTANPTVIATTTLTPAATAILTPTPADTAVTTTATPVPPVATATPAAPGLGIGLSIIGLFACFILAKRKNK